MPDMLSEEESRGDIRLRVPEEMLQRLMLSRGSRTIAQEIERRLAKSFDGDDTNGMIRRAADDAAQAAVRILATHLLRDYRGG